MTPAVCQQVGKRALIGLGVLVAFSAYVSALAAWRRARRRRS